jgi:hypothetical protein
MNRMKQSWRIVGSITLLLAAIGFADGQTQVDLATQSKDVDFSVAISTKPAKAGTVIPPSCSVGEAFFKTNAPAGQNLYGCTSTNTWSQMGGTGGAGLASQLGDFAASNTSASVQTLGAGCSSATPCQIRTGAILFTMTAPVTLSLSGVSTSGTVFWYLSPSQVLTAGHNSSATLTCSAGCTVVTGITAFPPDATPLWQTTFTANAWGAINPATMDKRAFLSRNVIAPGSGISSSSDPTTGIQTLSTDPTIVPRYFTQVGAPSGSCTSGRDFDTRSDSPYTQYGCQNGSWATFGGGGGGGTAAIDFFNWPLVTYYNGGYLSTNVGKTNSTTVLGVSTVSGTGPASQSYAIGSILIYHSQSLMVTKQISSTWSAAAGTIDVSFTAINRDGNGGSNYNISVYAGCSTPGSTGSDFTYGTASTVSIATGSTTGVVSTYTAAGVNLPGSCAASSPLQIWLVRGADSNTSNLALYQIQATIRGN